MGGINHPPKGGFILGLPTLIQANSPHFWIVCLASPLGLWDRDQRKLPTHVERPVSWNSSGGARGCHPWPWLQHLSLWDRGPKANSPGALPDIRSTHHQSENNQSVSEPGFLHHLGWHVGFEPLEPPFILHPLIPSSCCVHAEAHGHKRGTV